jgi:hypothetical protein
MPPQALPPLVRSRITLLGVAALLLAALCGSVSAAPRVPLPEHDSFYRYTGSTPLSEIPPGTPLRQRTVTLGATTSETPLTAEQVLYRTTDATGHAVASVTTFVLPVTGTTAPRVVAYLSFYDAFVSKCNPSYTLRGGDPGEANAGQAQAEQAVVQALHAQGYVVTVPDFENQSLHFMAGTESGMSTLDAIKATLAVLDLEPATPVGMMGYSGGSIAADWAGELAPRYAPQLNLVGVAAGGMPVDLASILTYVDGDPKWSSITPAVLLGMARAYRFDLTPYLTPYGASVVKQVSRSCIGEFPGNLTLRRLLKPQYVDLDRVPAFRKPLDRLVMGSAPGRPRAPMLIVAGNLDGTGDGVTIAADQQALARQYCGQGLPVDYEEVAQGEHTQVGFAFMPRAFAFLAARFAGAPPLSSCDLLGPPTR